MKYAPEQFSLVAQWCTTLCNLMDCSMPGFPVHHQILELVQTHVHRVSDGIQPSHPLFSPSPAFNLSQLGNLFVTQWKIQNGKKWFYSSPFVLASLSFILTLNLITRIYTSLSLYIFPTVHVILTSHY